MNSNEILNKYINLIDKGYCSDCNELNCIDNFPHSKITHAIRELQQENKQLKEEKRKVRDYINKHCVNEKISKEVGYKCYTMADTNELEKIMKILGDKEN